MLRTGRSREVRAKEKHQKHLITTLDSPGNSGDSAAHISVPCGRRSNIISTGGDPCDYTCDADANDPVESYEEQTRYKETRRTWQHMQEKTIHLVHNIDHLPRLCIVSIIPFVPEDREKLLEQDLCFSYIPLSSAGSGGRVASPPTPLMVHFGASLLISLPTSVN